MVIERRKSPTWDRAQMTIILCLIACLSLSETLAKQAANNAQQSMPASGQTNDSTAGTLDEEQARQLAETWTKVFFSMARIPRNGSQMLIFPGLFNKTSAVELEGSSRDHNNANPADGHLTYLTENHAGSDASLLTHQGHHHSPVPIVVTNDSRLFVHGGPYVFEDVESQDEDQRQRRRLRSARHESDLLAADEEHISNMINTVFSTSRDFLLNQTVRAGVVRYLTQKMRSFGLVTGNQVFDPQEFSELFEGHTSNGTNVIGILPGELWGTKDDEVLVIGAHWDTVPNSGGMDDNGSGVTAVLEVARALTEGSCRPKHTIIFVAFDLEEVGCLGSIYFVRDFLIPQVLQAHGAKLKGAFILDTIMNYNETQFSQNLSPEWQKALPAFWTDLQAENRTGNFLALLYRKEVDATLASSFAAHWKGDTQTTARKLSTRDPKQEIPRRFRVNNKEITIMKADLDVDVETIKANSSKYRLKKVRMDLVADVGNRLELLTPWVDLLRSDHSRFWYHSIEGYPKSLPAVLITDTAPYRGVMQECYHQECDSSAANRQLKFANVKFLAKTCQTLIDTLVSLSDSKCLFQAGNRHSRPQRVNAPKPLFSASSAADSSAYEMSVLVFYAVLLPMLTRALVTS